MSIYNFGLLEAENMTMHDVCGAIVFDIFKDEYWNSNTVLFGCTP